ncbi:MAG TPA: GNAT family N-acetyltransferase [Tepidiformaceae bacterium]|nr:GNAT family N-acetyltransferase [Tepidiformaceae bacterium]
MVTNLFRKHDRAMRELRAADLGCAVDAFTENRLVVVPRPDSPRETFLALAITFGTGTVLSIDEAYREWAEANAPEPHYNLFKYPLFLEGLVGESARRGRKVTASGPNLGFTPATEPEPGELPAGLTSRVVDSGWRDEWYPRRMFENALGDPTDPHDFTWHFGVILADDSGEPLACAGGWNDGPGVVEIGVDVARAARGRGLAPLVVQRMAAEVLARGLIPTYYCAPTNVRSHRTALASGFLPIQSTIIASDKGALPG